jgi:hypothetical protein
VSFLLTFSCFSTCCVCDIFLSSFATEDRQVSERNAALERMFAGYETLWSDSRCRNAIVLLQDRAQHIGESVDGC